MWKRSWFVPAVVVIVYVVFVTLLFTLGFPKPEPWPAPVPAVPVLNVGSELKVETHLPGHRVFAKIIRKKVADRLEKDGWSLIGGDPKPLTKAEAKRIVDQVDDETVITGAHETGKLGDGTIMNRLGALFDWIVSHEDEIMAIVKFIMSIAAMFG